MPLLKNLKQHRILLDTHVWLWVMSGHSRISREFVRTYERDIKLNRVFVSPMSIWETGMLVQKGRIELETDTLEWVNTALEASGIRLCPITPRIAIQSSRLPGDVHGDPVDRLLIATAFDENLVLITCDQKILEYSSENLINTFDPS
jgi:PIN domain nuclease of toxin-antitoxin system